MEAKQIITELYRNPRLTEVAKRYGKHDYEDVLNDFFLSILSKPDEFIIDLYNRDVLQYYSVVAIINICRKNYRSKQKEVYLIQESEPDYETEQIILKEFNSMQLTKGFPYHKAIVELIVKLGTQSEVSRQTGIPLNTVNNCVKEVRRYLKSRLC